MKFLLTSVSIALTLSACAPAVYKKAGATEEDFQREKYSCQRDANSVQPTLGMFQDPMLTMMERADFYKQCMAAHGWTRSNK